MESGIGGKNYSIRVRLLFSFAARENAGKERSEVKEGSEGRKEGKVAAAGELKCGE